MTTRSMLLTKNLLQAAVYWSTPVNDGYGGRTFAAAVEIVCRWEQRQELFIDAAGQEKTSKAIVYLSQDVDLGGYLYLGTLASLGASPVPNTVAAAFEIRGFGKIPNIRATEYERKVWL